MDSIGNNNGVLFGAANVRGPGEVGDGLESLDFIEVNYSSGIAHGTSSGMTVMAGTNLNFPTNQDFSIAAWINITPALRECYYHYGIDLLIDVVGEVTGVPSVNKGTNVDIAGGYALYLLGGRLGFEMKDTNGFASGAYSGGTNNLDDPSYLAGKDLRDGFWHHVAVSVQRTNPYGGVLYVDGAAVAAFDPTFRLVDLNISTGDLDAMSPLWIGVDDSGLPFSVDTNCISSEFIIEQDHFDEVMMYSRALSSCDVWELQSTGSAGLACPPPVEPPPPPPPAGVPVILSFAPSPAVPGTNEVISGINFSATTSSNIVYFGAVQATVLTASTNLLIVTVPVGATYAPISVTVAGLTGYSDQPFSPTFAGSGVLTNTSLADPFDLGVGGGPYSVAIGDIDGDGKPDVVVAHASDGTVYVFRNVSTNGTLVAASFASPVVVQLGGTNGNGLYGLALGDLTGDGRLDIVAPNWANNSIAILQNLSSTGSISFGSPVYLPVGSTPLNVAVGDLDGDGFADIVSVNWGNSTVSVLRNLGAGGLLTSNSFAPQFELAGASGTHAAIIADLDGDGKPEIIVANNSGASDKLSVFHNVSTNGSLSTNSFGPRVDFAGGGERLAVGDLDGDGKPDVAVASWQDEKVYVFRNTTTPGIIDTNSFAPHVALGLGGRGHEVEIADIDGDGLPDLAAVTEEPDQLLLFKNTSTPGSISTNSFADPVVFSHGYNEGAVAIGDIDGDGQPDIFVGNYYDNTVSVYRNTVTRP